MSRTHPRHRVLRAAMLVPVVLGSVMAVPGAAEDVGAVRRAAGQGRNSVCRSDEIKQDPVTKRVFYEGEDNGTPGLMDAQWNYHKNFGGVTADASGRVYVAQANSVRGANGLVVGLAPGKTAASDPAGAPATEVNLTEVRKLTVDPSGRNLYFAEAPDLVSKNRIWHVNPLPPTRTLRAITTTTGAVGGLATDATGNLFIGQKSGAISMVPAGSNELVAAGTGPTGLSSLAVDPTGSLLFMTTEDPAERHQVLMLNRVSGQLRSIAGKAGPTGSDAGDGGPASVSSLKNPASVTVDADGRYLYFLDQTPQRVRRILLKDMTIDTVVGAGAEGEAAELPLNSKSIAASGDDLYIGDFENCQVLRVVSPSPRQVAAVEPNPPPPGPTPPNGTGGTGTTNSDPGAAGNITTSPQSSQGPVGPVSVTSPGSSTGNEVGVSALSQNSPPGQGGLTSQSGLVNNPPGPLVPASADPSSAVATSPNPPVPAEGTVSPASLNVLTPAPGGESPGNVGLVGVDTSGSRVATRYAMVRTDEESPLTAVATLVGAVLLAVFACVLLTQAEPVRKVRPRPKGAY